MTLLTEFLGGILRALFKLVLFLVVLVFIASVLVAGLLVALLTAVWFLLTGRKPAAVTTFMRFRQASQQFRPGAWPSQSGQPSAVAADVVDVQAHEVPDTLIGTSPPSQPPESRG